MTKHLRVTICLDAKCTKCICAADIVMGINCCHVFPLPENDNGYGLRSENVI